MPCLLETATVCMPANIGQKYPHSVHLDIQEQRGVQKDSQVRKLIFQVDCKTITNITTSFFCSASLTFHQVHQVLLWNRRTSAFWGFQVYFFALIQFPTAPRCCSRTFTIPNAVGTVVRCKSEGAILTCAGTGRLAGWSVLCPMWVGSRLQAP